MLNRNAKGTVGQKASQVSVLVGMALLSVTSSTFFFLLTLISHIMLNLHAKGSCIHINTHLNIYNISFELKSRHWWLCPSLIDLY